jgi:Protein of unknown function (DUF2842)
MSEPLRKLIAMVLLLVGLAVYCLAAMLLMSKAAHLPVLVQMLGYLVFGIGWIFPCYPLLVWMQTGRWRK